MGWPENNQGFLWTGTKCPPKVVSPFLGNWDQEPEGYFWLVLGMCAEKPCKLGARGVIWGLCPC